MVKPVGPLGDGTNWRYKPRMGAKIGKEWQSGAPEGALAGGLNGGVKMQKALKSAKW